MRPSARQPLVVIRDAFNEPPGFDMAISQLLLERANTGNGAQTLRVVRPGRVLAFGPADRRRDGYDAAREAARIAGFAAVDRLAGGRATVFHEDTIAFAWTVPDPDAREHIRQRFDAISTAIAQALRRLGVDAHIGAVAGEYCPGAYSVNVSGRTKVMGVGQRVLRRAAHVGGVIVVDGSERVREPLVSVYDALGLEWDPASVGSVTDAIGPTAWETVADAVLGVIAEQFDVREGELDADLLSQALRAKSTASPPGRNAPHDT